MKTNTTKLYLSALITTLLIFAGAFYISNYTNARKTQELKAIENKIAIDILSFETQFDVIEESSCQSFDKSSIKTQLQELSSKLTFLEGQVGLGDPDVAQLKRYYALLQIRDYLLTKRMSEECKLDNIFVLYFYSRNNCDLCQRQEYIIRAIRNTYPQVEIYRFDYDMDVPAVQTLISTHHIPRTPPIIDINGKAYQPFSSLEEMDTVLRGVLQETASSTATSTKPQLQ
jgi:hypothetical protein